MTSAMDDLDAAFQGATSPGKVGLEALNLAVETQKFLQKSVNAILPVMLVLGGVGTIIYRFMSVSYETGVDTVKAFLVMLVVQLLPMAALKIKTWICTERVSLMPAALVKTLMMQIAVSVFRITFHIYSNVTASYMAVEMWQQAFDGIALVIAVYILVKEFDVKIGSLASKDSFLEAVTTHRDVLTTIVGGCCMAFVVNVVAPLDGKGAKVLWILNDFANYMECLAFVPVCRIVCLENAVEEKTPGANVDACNRRKAQAFMAFILAFYFWDDIIFTVSMSEIPLVVAAKAAHFLMLMDFAGYFILQVGGQPEIVDEILPKLIPAAILQEVAPNAPQADADLTRKTGERRGLLDEDDEDEEAGL